MYSGNVLSDPALNSVMMKSSIDRANDSRAAAARMPGRISGNVTFQNVRIGSAPRSWAACSSVQSKPRTRPAP